MVTIAADKQLTIDRLAALADGTRAGIVERLARRPHTASELHAAFDIAAPAVSRHLRVLREAGLIEEQRPEHDKRVRLYTLRREPLEQLGAWLASLTTDWQGQLDAFKDFAAIRTAPVTPKPKQERP